MPHERSLAVQISAAPGDLPKLRDRGLDVQRLPAYVTANSAGKLGRGDPVWVGSAAGDGHAWTVPLIERTF
jgi:hypothetical protein